MQGLKAALALAALPPAAVGEPLPDTRFFDAVNVIFSYQNANGGWPTYELQRSFAAIEVLNPAETFGDIMVDYSYVECSSACMTALCAFRKRFPDHRGTEIATALRRGRVFIESIQRDDGSWYGSWAVCFTYGCWFGAKALRALGETVETCDAQRRVAAFLTQRQRSDGGWGESYLSCQDKVYSQLSGANPPPPLHMHALLLMRLPPAASSICHRAGNAILTQATSVPRASSSMTAAAHGAAAGRQNRRFPARMLRPFTRRTAAAQPHPSARARKTPGAVQVTRTLSTPAGRCWR